MRDYVDGILIHCGSLRTNAHTHKRTPTDSLILDSLSIQYCTPLSSSHGSILGLLTQTCAASTMLVVAHLAVVVLAASSVLAGTPDLPVSPPTSSVGVISPPVTPTAMIGNSASTPIPSPPAPPIGMRRMYPPVPPSLPSASPPVRLPEPVQELTNSERLARGLPIRAPRLIRVLPGSEGRTSPLLLLLLFYLDCEPS